MREGRFKLTRLKTNWQRYEKPQQPKDKNYIQIVFKVLNE